MRAEHRRALKRARLELRALHHAEHRRGPLPQGLGLGLAGVLFCAFMVGWEVGVGVWWGLPLMVPLTALNTWLLVRGIRQETFRMIQVAGETAYRVGRQGADGD